MGECPRGSAHIQTDLTFDADVPVLQSMLKLESPAADVSEIFAEQAHRGFCFHLRASFVEFLVVDQHLPRENESLRTFAGACQSAVDQKFVESEFQVWLGIAGFREQRAFARGCSTTVPALAPV